MIFGDGFESGSLANWTYVQGLTLQSNQVARGKYAVLARSTTGTPAFARARLGIPQYDLYYHIQFKILSLGSNAVNLMQFFAPNGRPIVTVRVNPSHKLIYWDNAAGTGVASDHSVSLGGWHNLRVHLHISGTSGQVQIWYDGAEILSLSRTGNFGTAPIGQLVVGEWRSGLVYNIAFDNIWAYVLGSSTSMLPSATSPVASILPVSAAFGGLSLWGVRGRRPRRI